MLTGLTDGRDITQHPRNKLFSIVFRQIFEVHCIEKRFKCRTHIFMGSVFHVHR